MLECLPYFSPPASGHIRIRGRSSAGRASRSQCEGREFDPPRLHQITQGRTLSGLFHGPHGAARSPRLESAASGQPGSVFQISRSRREISSAGSGLLKNNLAWRRSPGPSGSACASPRLPFSALQVSREHREIFSMAIAPYLSWLLLLHGLMRLHSGGAPKVSQNTRYSSRSAQRHPALIRRNRTRAAPSAMWRYSSVLPLPLKIMLSRFRRSTSGH